MLREIAHRPVCSTRRYLIGFEPVVPATNSSSTGNVTSMRMDRHSSAGAQGRSNVNGDRGNNSNSNSTSVIAFTSIAPESISDEDFFDLSVHSVEMAPQRAVRVIPAAEVRRYSDTESSPFALSRY